MNKPALLELVAQWITFSDIHPEGTPKEFAEWILAEEKHPAEHVVQPAEQRGFIGYQLGILFRFVSIWEKKAFADLPLRGFNEFGVLATVAEAGFPRKSDVVKELMIEPSTGFEIIKKMVREGFLAEVTDSDDHRSVRLKLSPLGRRVFQEVSVRIDELSRLLLGDLPPPMLEQLLHLLMRLNAFHHDVYAQHHRSDWKTIRTDLSIG